MEVQPPNGLATYLETLKPLRVSQDPKCSQCNVPGATIFCVICLKSLCPTHISNFKFVALRGGHPPPSVDFDAPFCVSDAKLVPSEGQNVRIDFWQQQQLKAEVHKLAETYKSGVAAKEAAASAREAALEAGKVVAASRGDDNPDEKYKKGRMFRTCDWRLEDYTGAGWAFAEASLRLEWGEKAYLSPDLKDLRLNAKPMQGVKGTVVIENKDRLTVSIPFENPLVGNVSSSYSRPRDLERVKDAAGRVYAIYLAAEVDDNVKVPGRLFKGRWLFTRIVIRDEFLMLVDKICEAKEAKLFTSAVQAVVGAAPHAEKATVERFLREAGLLEAKGVNAEKCATLFRANKKRDELVELLRSQVLLKSKNK